MTLEPTVANAFIAGYKGLLLEIGLRGRAPKSGNVLSVLAAARRQLTETPGLLDKALVKLRARSEGVDEEIVRAVRTLRVNAWVFLRDTKAYSIFVHPSEETAFGVLGLTQPVRDIAGASGVAIETGIVRFTGRFVCDGLVTRIVHLGPNYRKSYSRVYKAAKAEGRFYVCDEDLTAA
ncbi:MAG: hypothetical protein ACREYC_12580 [Gammaproteobacteria bacterium]